MQLRQLVDPKLFFQDLPAGSRDAVLRELAQRLEAQGAVPDAEDVYRKLTERELLGSTAIGHGVAIPHCKLSGLDRVVVAVGVTAKGVPIEAPDGDPVRVFFVVVSPTGSPAEHLQTLAAISRWLKENSNLERIRRARTVEEIDACLCGAAEEADVG